MLSSSKDPPNYQDGGASSKASLILMICLTAGHLVQQVGCIAGAKCDFDKHINGCYNEANLVCDKSTHVCVCSPGTPVLINGRFCVKSANLYESCQYSEQCDMARGNLCYQTDPELSELLDKECDLITSVRCQCLNPDTELNLNQERSLENNGTNNKSSDGFQTLVTANNQNQAERQQQPASPPLRADRTISRVRTSHYHTHPHLMQQQHAEQNGEFHKQHHGSSSSNHNHSNASTLLTRIVWLVLILSLISLVLLLFAIKYHSSFRESERPLQRANDDRISIRSEPDVPPPYEVAIRMKV